MKVEVGEILSRINDLEEEIASLRAYAEESRKVIEYYSNQDHWIGYHRDCTSIIDDEVPAKASDDFDIVVGGKRARVFQQSETYKKVFGDE